MQFVFMALLTILCVPRALYLLWQAFTLLRSGDESKDKLLIPTAGMAILYLLLWTLLMMAVQAPGDHLINPIGGA